MATSRGHPHAPPPLRTAACRRQLSWVMPFWHPLNIPSRRVFDVGQPQARIEMDNHGGRKRKMVKVVATGRKKEGRRREREGKEGRRGWLDDDRDSPAFIAAGRAPSWQREGTREEGDERCSPSLLIWLVHCGQSDQY